MLPFSKLFYHGKCQKMKKVQMSVKDNSFPYTNILKIISALKNRKKLTQQ